MCITRYSLDHELFCAVCLYELHLKSSRRVVRAYVVLCTAAKAAAPGRREAMLGPLCQPGETNCVCISYGSSCLILVSNLNLAYHGFGEQCTQKRYSKTTGIMNRISNTTPKPPLLPDSSHCRYYIFINTVLEEIFFFLIRTCY